MMKRFGFLFLLCLSVIGSIRAEEKLLYSTTFQDWESSSASDDAVVVPAKTHFSNEDFSFSLSQVVVSPTGTDSKFTSSYVTPGYIRAEKKDNSAIEISALESVTKIEFVEAATGNDRGLGVQIKYEGQSEWETIFDTPLDGTYYYDSNNEKYKDTQGHLVSISIPEEKQKNVSIRFYNLNGSQYAFLLSLDIYGDYVSTAEQVTLSTKTNIEGAGNISVFPVSETYDINSTVKISAEAAFGYEFVNWTDDDGGAVLGSDPELELVLNTDRKITANFNKLTLYKLTVSVNGSRWGKISFSPEAEDNFYPEGTIVTLSVVDNPVTIFGGWSDGQTEKVRTVQITGNVELSANFDQKDFIVGWDFNDAASAEKRKEIPAPFYSESMNQGLLSAYEPTGASVNWLYHAAEYTPAHANARLWTTDFSSRRYFQAQFSTKGYTNIEVTSLMSGSYQVYSKQKMQYSLDNKNFKDLVTIDLSSVYGQSLWEDCIGKLPVEAEDQSMVYIRWIADETSTILGSGNDGTTLANVFVFADPKNEYDPEAPVLASSVPAEGSSSASANGALILNFNKKIKAGTGDVVLNGISLVPEYGSTSVTLPYTKLAYNTPYSVDIPAGFVTNVSGIPNEAFSVTFTTMSRPDPIAKVFDVVVAQDGSGDYTSVKEAIDAAPSDRTSPWLIYIKAGKYQGHLEIAKPYIHLIGEDAESVIISDDRVSGDNDLGKPVYSPTDGATVYVTGDNFYATGISFENEYGITTQDGPQALALCTYSDRAILNRCKLRSYQDTYLTSNKTGRRHFLNECFIEGAVDYIYGAGDVFFNKCTLYNTRKSGGYIVAPNHKKEEKWGYVFDHCVIDGNADVEGLYFGRPWHDSPKTVFLYTTCKVPVYAKGWYFTMGGIPEIWADYKTVDAYGDPVDVSLRNDYYYYYEGETIIDESTGQPKKDENGVTMKENKIEGYAKNSLTDEEAAAYTIENVMSGSDDWDPAIMTESVEAPSGLKIEGKTLSWEASKYVICYVVKKNGSTIGFVKADAAELVYEDELMQSGDEYTVQGVSEYGMLSELSEVVKADVSGIETLDLPDYIAYRNGDEIVVRNIPESATVSAYSLTGTVLAREKVSEGTFRISTVQPCIIRIVSEKKTSVFKML